MAASSGRHSSQEDHRRPIGEVGSGASARSHREPWSTVEVHGRLVQAQRGMSKLALASLPPHPNNSTRHFYPQQTPPQSLSISADSRWDSHWISRSYHDLSPETVGSSSGSPFRTQYCLSPAIPQQSSLCSEPSPSLGSAFRPSKTPSSLPTSSSGLASLSPGLHHTTAHHRRPSRSTSVTRRISPPDSGIRSAIMSQPQTVIAGPSNRGSSSHILGPAASHGSASAAPTAATGFFFQPLLQQISESRMPTPAKDKSSLELENVDDYAMTSKTGLPDRFETRTPALMSSSDGDTTTSQSGLSRSSTPFHGEWISEGTDYESAFEADAVIAMDSVGPIADAGSGASSWTQAAKKGGKNRTAGRLEQDSFRYQYREPSWLQHGTASSDSQHRGFRKHYTKWLDWLSMKVSLATKSGGYQLLQPSNAWKSPKALNSPQGPYACFDSRDTLRWDSRGSSPQFHPSMLRSPRQLVQYFGALLQSCLQAYHPAKILLTLLFVAGFVATTTALIIYILNPDKEPKAWRTFCAQSKPFPHDLADSLAPVDVFVGVMTMDSRFERRAIIRQTYVAHTLPVDSVTGQRMSNVQVKFVMGKPRRALQRRIALEMEMYNDIVVLDVKENMNAGKTHAFFSWAAANATVPILRPLKAVTAAQTSIANQQGTAGDQDGHSYDVAWKKVDYVVKADDDAFLVLRELERHLRVAPRKMTYWGYLIRNWFMAGEAYALSADLVSYVATSPQVAAHIKGKEDKVTSRWIRLHPLADKINYLSERCWIYDHPKTGTAYAHGFLFPDEVQRIKAEHRNGLSPEETQRRGGVRASQWYSTVSKWHHKWSPPLKGLTVEEELESLVEGGGLYAATGFANRAPRAEVSWTDRVYEAEDERLEVKSRSKGSLAVPARLRGDWRLDSWSSLPVYGLINQTASLLARDVDDHEDLGDVGVTDADEQDEDVLVPPGSPGSPFLLSHLPLVGALKHFAAAGHHNEAHASARSSAAAPSSATGIAGLRVAESKRVGVSMSPQPMHPDTLPVPHSAALITLPSGDRIKLSQLRRQRHLMHGPAVPTDGGEAAASSEGSVPSPVRGGTVVVHFLKRNEWFFETALALIGRDVLRGKDASSGSRGQQWSMYGSPKAAGFGDLPEYGQ